MKASWNGLCEEVHNLAERIAQVKGIPGGKSDCRSAVPVLKEGWKMSIFTKYIKSLTILAMLGGGLSACSTAGAPNLGAYNQVDRLVQVGCNDRIGGNN